MRRAKAYAKLNLALVVGSRRPDGKHEVSTIMQAIDLHDDVALEPAPALVVDGFADDTMVRAALEAIAARAGVAPRWRARIEKRIPVAAGLGGGSSDAAAALRLANAQLRQPLAPEALHELAAGLGADVPFFLGDGPRLATGDGTNLAPIALPTNYVVLIAVADADHKASTAAVYRRFDERRGADGFAGRRADLMRVLQGVEEPAGLACLPRNDLASSPLSEELEGLGAFRADVTGAGPAVFALFEDELAAQAAGASLRRGARTWIARPVAGGPRPGG